ncbi:hypothetical protein CC85DRAFT_304940 [Cutaneotrichosporon oleaginosum]|uniref:U three protein 23 n=1 Tax=Cutaneotrichosporon oleaginosum TaxID=879819 RepID=A0A0J0XES6_9TREE|nr:uncharacterized protein CC85DRAFT_304940 [Cutaneotrichosporon oleaginosum]KLT39570.1 hypothetical protein CC85DRAFT_304940 [Cutaneotrichosporon oleaginosum]TXT08026.1 hypothetical protein COLE_04950 [Cutaneotrichosporon oleaginosum]
MRQKRAKAYKRVMALYVGTFGFRTPYQVLLGDDFLLEAAKQKDVDWWKMLGTTVQGEVKPMITQCCIEALYRKGREFQHVVDMAKRAERRKCNHREAVAPGDCLKDMVGDTNKHRYVLAVQSQPLIAKLSTTPGLPVMHYNARGVLVLSPPSTATVRAKNAAEEEKRSAGAKLLDGVVDGANVLGAGAAPEEGRRRKVKGPNPLSVKKKKVKEPEVGKKRKAEEKEEEEEREKEEAGDDEGRRKKKRKRGRGKGAVATAIAEINAAGGIGFGAQGSDASGSDSE